MTTAAVRIACVLVRGSNREGPNHFRLADADQRLDLLGDCAKAAERVDAQILLLPAGFFTVQDGHRRRHIEAQAKHRLAGSRLLVAFGIDVSGEGSTKQSSRGGALPFYGYACEAGGYLIGGVRQTGAHAGDVDDATVAAVIAERIRPSATVGGRTVALLLCGELGSKAWRDGLGAKGPDVVLHLAHASVNLAGAVSRSWLGRVKDLLAGLHETSVWALSDHIMAQQHLSGGEPASLVLRATTPPKPAVCVKDEGVGAKSEGWMYVYDI